MKLQLQCEANECGLACLAMVAGHYGYCTDLAELRQRFSVSLQGTTVAQLIRHAGSLELAIRPLRAELDELSNIQLPCILHWDLDHFVVLERKINQFHGGVKFIVLDPARGRRIITLDEASNHFTGVVLEITPTPDFVPKRAKKKSALGIWLVPSLGYGVL